jgi:hypothetical protein
MSSPWKTTYKNENQIADWEKIFCIHVTNRGLIGRLKNIHNSGRRQKNSIKWENTSRRQYIKEDI